MAGEEKCSPIPYMGPSAPAEYQGAEVCVDPKGNQPPNIRLKNGQRIAIATGQTNPVASVARLHPDEQRAGYCTAPTGFVTQFEASLDPRRGTLAIFGRPALSSPEPVPVFIHHAPETGEDYIAMPYRETLFQFGTAEPVDQAAFDKTISAMVKDIENVVNGDFARICGLRRLKDFGGALTVSLIGMTDRVDSNDFNLRLSEARAKRVADAVFAKLQELQSRSQLKTKDGIIIKYAGVGEELFLNTPDGIQNPDFRRVEMRIQSGGEPNLGVKDVQWKEAGRIPPAKEEETGFNFEDECVGEPEGCADLLQQCLDSIAEICKQVYPFDPSYAAQCSRDLSTYPWSLSTMPPQHHEAERWLRRGLFHFHLRHGTGAEHTKSYSLSQCLGAGRRLLQREGLHTGGKQALNADDVIDPSATRMDDQSGMDVHCTQITGPYPSGQFMIVEEPRGKSLWFEGRRVARFGEDMIISRDTKRGEEIWTAPIRYFAADNAESVKTLVRDDVTNLLEWSGIYPVCSSESKKTARVIVEINSNGDEASEAFVGSLRAELERDFPGKIIFRQSSFARCGHKHKAGEPALGFVKVTHPGFSPTSRDLRSQERGPSESEPPRRRTGPVPVRSGERNY